MITNSNEQMSVGGGFLSVEEFYGLSTDSKPTNTANGSTFFEMDTGKMYRFNYSGTTWTEATHYGSDGFGPTPSGGGGGSTGGGVLVVNLTLDMDTGVMMFDKTWSEVNAAPAAVAYIDNSALGGTGASRFLIGETDAVGNGDGSFTYRVLGMVTESGSDGFTVSCVPFTTNSTDGYPVVSNG